MNDEEKIEDFLVDVLEELRKSVILHPDLIETKNYRNYRIELILYDKDKVCKGYYDSTRKIYRKTKTYKKGIIYAIGFEYDPTGEFAFKYGKTIGTGKTVEEAFQKAKKYINNEWKEQGKTYHESKVQLNARTSSRHLVRKMLKGEI